MSQVQSIPRRNKVDWHMANDGPILITMRFIPQHEVVQKYDAILPDNLTTQAMKESKAYKTYYAFATRKAIPKPKYVRRSSKEKPEQAPEASSGKRLKATAKVTKSRKKKQPAKGLKTLSEIAFFEAVQMKLAIERSKTQLHNSQPSGSGVHEGTGITPGVLDVPIYGSDEEKIYWKSNDEEDDDDEANIGKDEYDNDQDDDERTKSDNDGDDLVYPKLSTHDDEARNDDKVNEEESNEANEEVTHEDDEANELYRDVNVNLERRDTMMTDASLLNVQATQETEDTHVILTALINPEDVLVTTIVEPPLVFATTLPLPPTPLITHIQQTLVPTPTTVPSTSLQDLPNFGSLFGFDHRLKTLETDFSEFKQTNQFTEALQFERLRDETQAENEDFLNKLDDNIKKIIKDQVKEQVKAQVSKILPKIKKTVNKQLKAEVMTRLSTESKTSLAIAANLSELELKKILIDKMESNKSIHRSDAQKNLY
ncbi:hypothetical protein Tco_1505090, partial [Tanacetum coccineum]